MLNVNKKQLISNVLGKLLSVRIYQRLIEFTRKVKLKPKQLVVEQHRAVSRNVERGLLGRKD
jgi:hypothetical protein